MLPNVNNPARGVSRAGHYWCNICQQPCESDEALREHYRRNHPDIAAKIEQLAARMRQADGAPAPEPRGRSARH